MNFVEDFYSNSSQVIPLEEPNQYANGLAGPIPNGSGNSSGYHSGSATPPSYSLTSTVPSAQVINIGTQHVHHVHHVHQYFGSHGRPSSTLELQSSAFHNVIHSPMETSQGQPSSDSLHQKIIHKHAPELQDGMNPDILLSHLMKHDLVSREDIEIINNKDKTTRERNMQILTRVPFRGSGACERFVSCLEEARGHPRHGELAQILRNEMDQLTQRRYKQRSKKQCRRKHSLSLEVTSSSDTASEPEARVTHQRRRQAQCFQDETSYKRKLQWLEEKVSFASCAEAITLTAKTNYKAERRILEWETFYEGGSLRILILCNDCLLLLKPLNTKDNFKWFSHCGFTAKMPLLLHVLETEKNPHDTNSFTLRVKSQSLLDEIHLQAHNTLARNYWIEKISEAIKSCKDARAKCAVPMWNMQSHTQSTELWKTMISLSIRDASVNASALPAQSSTHHLFCSVRLISKLGKNRLTRRTPTVGVNLERKAHAFWNTEELVISTFKKTDILEIRVMQENSFCPNDVIGYCKVDVSKITTEVEEMNMPLHSECQDNGSIRIALGSYMYK